MEVGRQAGLRQEAAENELQLLEQKMGERIGQINNLREANSHLQELGREVETKQSQPTIQGLTRALQAARNVFDLRTAEAEEFREDLRHWIKS